MIVALALCAAAFFGFGVAFQQRAAAGQPDESLLRAGLLIRLLHRPLWLLGLLADIVGFVLQAAALRRGSLVLVQPLLVLSVVFSLGMAAGLAETKVSLPDWFGVLAVVMGLTAFLLAASPTNESNGVTSADRWALLFLVLVGVIFALAMSALRVRPPLRTVLLALAAGFAEAGMAVVTKAFATRIELGWWRVFESWEPYALAAGGVLTMLLLQSAYQSGHVMLSVPLIATFEPIASSLIGATLFRERIETSFGRVLAVTVGVAIGVAGITRLSRAPLLVPVDDAPSAVNQ